MFIVVTCRVEKAFWKLACEMIDALEVDTWYLYQALEKIYWYKSILDSAAVHHAGILVLRGSK